MEPRVRLGPRAQPDQPDLAVRLVRKDLAVRLGPRAQPDQPDQPDLAVRLEEGPAGPLTAFLPKGKTETGVFSMRLEGAGGANLPAHGFGDSPRHSRFSWKNLLPGNAKLHGFM